LPVGDADKQGSVHYLSIPTLDDTAVNVDIERRAAALHQVSVFTLSGFLLFRFF
jgi:hypothetical protein